MKVYIYGVSEDALNLQSKVGLVLEELGLTDFVLVENTQDENFKSELWIMEDSALVIEEESINFKDMIFEWMVPEAEELKSMFVSIIGWGASGWCAPWGCGSGCSC